MADNPNTPEKGTPSTDTPNGPAKLPDDHPLVKAAAARKSEIADLKRQLADAQNAGKSDAEKTDERIAALEKELGEAKVTALRASIAAKHKLDETDAAMFLTATDKDGLEAQAKRLAERTSEARKGDGIVPGEGSNPNPSGGDQEMREFTRAVFADTTK